MVDAEAAADELVAAFTAGMRARGLSADDPAWVPWLRRAWQRALMRWPQGLRAAAYGTGLAARVRPGERPGELDHALQLEDLALVCACLDGDAHAIAALEHGFARHLDQVFAGITDLRLGEDDKRQIVRVHLFVAGPDRPAAIATYSGRGSFVAWLRVTAKRALLNAVRRHEPARVDADDEAVADALAATAPDAELALLGAGYREAFRGAFRHALAQLTVRERGLLRQVTTGGLSVRDLGRIHGVHHATAARWLRQAYDALLGHLKRALAQSLSADERGVDSVLSMIRSGIDASFAGL
ncbi:MAG: sigma-70 family RNA polymerase sigma factor [Nannocystaceae bacterium]